MSGEDGLAIERVLGALRDHGSRVEERGGSWMAQCPSHEDGKASLSITRGATQPVALVCLAGCATGDVLAAIGLTYRDVSAPTSQPADVWTPAGPAVAIYDYTDETGKLLFQVLRTADKQFRQRRPDPSARSGWRWQLGDTRRTIYRLPRVVEAVRDGQTIWIAEGEKDVNALESAGVVATCNPGGAGKWRDDYDQVLAGADVRIVQDRDEPGRKHGLAVAEGLRRVGCTVTICEALTGKDAADHLAAGHSLDSLSVVQSEPAEAGSGDAAPDASATSDSGGKRSQASLLVALAKERFNFVMSEDGRPYAVLCDGPNIALPLRGSRGVRTRLAAIFADVTGGAAPSQSALADALAVLEGFAVRKDPVPVHLRLARHGDSIVIDLGTADGRCVIVGPDGWRRQPRSPVLFRRTALTSAIPDPVREGDGLSRLAGLLNTTEASFRLLAGWMVASLIPEIPHPILAFKGEQGTGKTTAARSVVQIIDPSPAPLRTAPRDVKQWVVVAAASWAVCLDNVNAISGWLSETLCRAVTGDGNVDRALYTDDDVTVLAFRRVVMMTSIDAGHLDGDLAERLLLIELSPLKEGARRTDAELTAAYADAQPSIFAGLLDLTASALKRLPDARPDSMPRMADFVCVLQAVDDATGWSTVATYTAAADTVAADVLEGDAFGQAVAAKIHNQPDKQWKGTAGELLELVTPEKAPKNWPKDATRAGGRLKRLAPLLRQAGISYDDSERQKDGNRSRLYALAVIADGQHAENSAGPAPAVPAVPGMRSDLHERAGASAGASDIAAPGPPAPGPAPGAAGAGAGAGHHIAPAAKTSPDQAQHALAGAPGAPGADTLPLSDGGLCSVCGDPMRPDLAGIMTTHPTCEPEPAVAR